MTEIEIAKQLLLERTCVTCSEHVDMSIRDERPWFACHHHDDNYCDNWVPWDYEGPFIGPEEENK